MGTKLKDCNCLQYVDKIKIIGALHTEKDRLKKIVTTLNKTEGAFKKFRNEIIPEYIILIEQIENTPDCKYKFD